MGETRMNDDEYRALGAPTFGDRHHVAYPVRKKFTGTGHLSTSLYDTGLQHQLLLRLQLSQSTAWPRACYRLADGGLGRTTDCHAPHLAGKRLQFRPGQGFGAAQ